MEDHAHLVDSKLILNDFPIEKFYFLLLVNKQGFFFNLPTSVHSFLLIHNVGLITISHSENIPMLLQTTKPL